MVADLKAEGVEALSGNAADPTVIAAANLGRRAACWSPSPTPSKAARWCSRHAPSTPSLPIIARAHSEAEIEHLLKHGASLVVMGEHEIAKAMIDNINRAGSAIAPRAWT